MRQKASYKSTETNTWHDQGSSKFWLHCPPPGQESGDLLLLSVPLLCSLNLHVTEESIQNDSSSINIYKIMKALPSQSLLICLTWD